MGQVQLNDGPCLGITYTINKCRTIAQAGICKISTKDTQVLCRGSGSTCRTSKRGIESSSRRLSVIDIAALRDLLDHPATPRRLACWLSLAFEQRANRSLQPLIWHGECCALSVLNVAYEEWIWSFWLRLDFLTRLIDINGALAATLWRLLLEKTVNSVELNRLATAELYKQ